VESPSVRLFLPGPDDTLALGRVMALTLPAQWQAPTALLRAGLGSGKTTLTRGFVSALPGAELAEVASPSFNLVNLYPTDPPVAHVDLYRLGEGFADAGLEELLEGSGVRERRALIVEWAEYLPPGLNAPDRLEISLAPRNHPPAKGQTAPPPCGDHAPGTPAPTPPDQGGEVQPPTFSAGRLDATDPAPRTPDGREAQLTATGPMAALWLERILATSSWNVAS